MLTQLNEFGGSGSDDPPPQLHYLFKEPKLITGIADFVQIYMRYTTHPVTGVVIFHFKVINITKFLLEQLTINLEASENVKPEPFQ